MNRKEMCCSQLCTQKCQNCQKIIKKDHTICFDEEVKIKPVCTSKVVKRSQDIQYIKKSDTKYQQDEKANKYKIKPEYPSTFSLDYFSKEKSFTDALKNFFTLSKEDVIESWKEQDYDSVEDMEPDNSFELLEKKIEALSKEHLVPDNNKIYELLPDVTKELSSSVKVNRKITSKVPDVTRDCFKIKKMKSYERVKRLLHKDFPLFEKMIEAKKIKRNAFGNDFIWQWFQHGHEQKHKELKSFSNVFSDIHELETTKEFCTWLIEHPEIEPPSYLVEQGLLQKMRSYRASSGDISRKLRKENAPHLSLEITDDYIRKHFQKLKFASLTSISGQSINHRLISDIKIII